MYVKPQSRLEIKPINDSFSLQIKFTLGTLQGTLGTFREL